jgi:uncharacterized membrane protein YcaP (DUF421 family)
MELVLRATAIFWFLFLVSRAVGRRELAQMSAFELMLLVIIGDLIQQGVTQNDMSVTGAMLAVSTLACWTVVLSYVSFRWRRTDPVLVGIPAVVVRDGHMMDEVLQIERVPSDEVLTAAREQGIDDLAKVRVGIIEPDGRFSFICFDAEQHADPNEKRATS